jgi:spore cortex formation protein SpoVR/YcgB (stage V sporulation)
MSNEGKKKKPIFTSSEWTPELMDLAFKEIKRIGEDEFKLDVYPNHIEIINSEQMVDAYSSIGMPIMYNHWSFGKSFINDYRRYQKGWMGLAYEIVINSDPCIAYCMEDNTMLMQTLVMAHACYGHNSFFKNNYLFKEWTDAGSIIDYLAYAKKYIAECEERYGADKVEELLDACHALKRLSVDHFKKPPALSKEKEQSMREERQRAMEAQVNDLWNTVIPEKQSDDEATAERKFPEQPEDNILRFVQENAPLLETWQREIIHIICNIEQYFYPQGQTSLMNEGWATFTHYNIITKMHDEGLITDGAYLEFLSSHTNVTYQPDFDHDHFSGINVYALGYAMFKDIQRISMNPTDEDREWFPSWAGNGDWLTTCTEAMKNFKDESFVQQFLSPKVIRDFKLFAYVDDDMDSMLEVTHIHNDRGYHQVREILADQYRRSSYVPNIQVTNVDVAGDRTLTLTHTIQNRVPLSTDGIDEVLKHLRSLWGLRS